MSAMPSFVASFHPASVDQGAQACKGRRTNPDHADRTFRPFIYAAFQCGNRAVQDGDGLCATCIRHRGGAEWHGRVDEPLHEMPITSHIAGGRWFHKMMAEGKFQPNDRPLTARQDAAAALLQGIVCVVPEAQLMRFARGEIDLDIETLAAKRMISAQGLWNIIGEMGIAISRKVRFGTKAGLCAAIREAKQPPAEAQPQHFNPEEDNYEAEAEVQHMAPAGDESPLNTAFCEAEAEVEAEQGGAAGGWLADEVEAEAGPRRKARRTLVPDWSQIPPAAPVRWVFHNGQSHLISNGRHVEWGKILFGKNLSKNLADFIKTELAVWKSLGRVPADMKPPHNAWKALEFERNGAWVRFDAIRTAVEV